MPPSSERDRRFLTAEWRHLAMLNYPVERDVLESLVPKGTMLDTYKGVAYVSVVGLSFLNTRVFGVPVPGHRNFAEVNLRFYVRRFSGDDWRRGVVFIKEIVSKRAVAVVARAAYNERYVSLPMRHAIEMRDTTTIGSVQYEWETKGSWNRLRATTGTMVLTEPAPGSLEEFVTEHYWGYVRQRNGATLEYQVEHPRWPVLSADIAELRCDIAALYGDRFVSSLQQPPESAFVANGSAVTVFRGRVLK